MLLSAGDKLGPYEILAPLGAWVNAPAVLDTLTGRVSPLPFDNVTDYDSPAWLPDGRIETLRKATRSTLWKFEPEGEQAR